MKHNTDISAVAFTGQPQIEAQVIYDVVSNPETLGEVVSIVTPDTFSSERLRIIWNHIVRQFNEGQQIDFVTVGSVMPTFVTDVLQRNPESSGPLQTVKHAKILRDTAARRRAYTAAYELMQKASNSTLTETDMLAAVEHCKAMVENGSQIVYETELQQAFNNLAEEKMEEEKMRDQGKAVRITTGYPSLDYSLLHGFAPGQLIVLAARPSVGKTANMLGMACAAARAGAVVNIFSIEMMESELATRLITSTGMVDTYDFASLHIDWEKFDAGVKTFDKSRILLNDKTRDLDGIVSRILINSQRGLCDIAFIDYLGLIRSDGYGNEKLYQTIGRITSTLKVTAKQARIPIVLLCQLNRESAKSDRAPELYDLRDSGSIEQDTDVVLMLEPKADGNLYMWVRKNRQGRRDFAISLTPNSTYTVFTDNGIVDEEK